MGKMNATACVIPPAPLFYRHLQMAQANTLERNFQNYNSRVALPTTCLEELNWWDTQMCKWNGKSILKTETDLTINSDASLKGWGARCHLHTTGGGMVTRGSEDAHQLLAAASCHSGSQIICQRQNQNFYLPKNRQYYSGGIHKSSGRYNLPRASEADKELVDVVPGKEYPHHGTTPPRVTEHDCRCGVSNYDRQDRLEAEPNYLSQDQSTMGPTGSGPLCFPPVNPVPTLLQLAARSICRSNRCVSPDMDTHEGICQPTMEPSGRTLSQVQTQQANIVLVVPVWKSQSWYPTLLLKLVDYPLLITSDHQVMFNQDPSMMLPQLAAWRISGRDTEVNTFRRKLLTSCSNHGEPKPTGHMTHYSSSGNAGVLNGVQIPFLVL